MQPLFGWQDVLSWKMMACHHARVQPTWGTRRVILAFSWLSAFVRFDGESTLRPQAANASRWADSLTICLYSAPMLSFAVSDEHNY